MPSLALPPSVLKKNANVLSLLPPAVSLKRGQGGRAQGEQIE